MSFIDLHSHCFPGMDDGAKTEAEALAMLQSAVKNDIKILYVSPHREPGGRFDPDNDTVLKAWRKLKKLASSNDLDIDVRYGEEFRIRTDSIDLIKNDQVLTYYKTDYVLVEFTRTTVFSKLVDQALEALVESGKKILIAHPERYFDDLKAGSETCRKWVEKGAFLQINRTSLTGFHGVYAEKLANKLIRLGLAHCVASDAHEAEGQRALRLDDVYHQVTKQHSKAQAEALFFTNPSLLIKNLPMETINRPKILAGTVQAIKARLHKNKKVEVDPAPVKTTKTKAGKAKTVESEPEVKGEDHE